MTEEDIVRKMTPAVHVALRQDPPDKAVSLVGVFATIEAAAQAVLDDVPDHPESGYQTAECSIRGLTMDILAEASERMRDVLFEAVTEDRKAQSLTNSASPFLRLM